MCSKKRNSHNVSAILGCSFPLQGFKRKRFSRGKCCRSESVMTGSKFESDYSNWSDPNPTLSLTSAEDPESDS